MEPSTLAATTIRHSAPGFAALSAERLLDRHPQVDERFGTSAFRLWKESLTARLGELAAALADGSPERFAERVQWARTSFRSRGVDPDDLRRGLTCLHEVLNEELPEGARPVAIQFMTEALAVFEQPEQEPVSQLDVETPNGRLALGYVAALLEGDRRGARRVILGAIEGGSLDPVSAYTEVLLPAQDEIGRMWLVDEIGVGEEHFVTSTTKIVMSQVLALAPTPESNGKCVITAAIEGDAHDVGAQALADLLELSGFRVIHLGADVPAADVAMSAQYFQADLVALSATLDPHRLAVARCVQMIRSEKGTGERAILVGGKAFSADPELWKSAGADAGADSIHDAVIVVKRLVGLS